MVRRTHGRKLRTRMTAPEPLPPLMMVSSRYTPQRGKQIVRLLRQGHYTDTAAASIGVTKDVVNNWLRTGARILDANMDQDFAMLAEQDRNLAQFALDVQQALARMETATLRKLKAVGAGWWQSYAWLLERRFPSKWGKQGKVTVTHENPPGSTIDAKILIASPDGIKAIAGVFTALARQTQRLGPGQVGASRVGEVRESGDVAVHTPSVDAERVPVASGSGTDPSPHRANPPEARQE